jgi:hypothetical protein
VWSFIDHVPHKVLWYGIPCSVKTTPLLLNQLISSLTILQCKIIMSNMFKTHLHSHAHPHMLSVCLSVGLSVYLFLFCSLSLTHARTHTHKHTHTTLLTEFLFTTGWVTSEDMEELNKLLHNYLFFFVMQWQQNKMITNK